MDLTEIDRRRQLREWIAGGYARRLRQEAGVSQQMAADAMGITPRAVWNWENGRTIPRTTHAETYHRFLEELAARCAS